MKYFKSLITTLLVIALALTVCAVALADEAGQEELKQFSAVKLSANIGLEDFEGVYEDSGMAMFIRQSDSNIAVVNRSNGDTYTLFPATLETDTVKAKSYVNQATQRSPLVIHYFTNATDTSMFSCEYNAANAYYKIDNGVRVVYTIGTFQKVWVIPNQLTEADFDNYVAQIEAIGTDEAAEAASVLTKRYRLQKSEGASSEDLARYPALAEQNLRIMRGNLADYIKDDIAEAFALVGYTEEQRDEDNKLDSQYAGAAEATTPYFVVTVDYMIEDGNFVIDVRAKDIEFNKTYPIYNVVVAPFFGAAYAESQEEGYMFVPDASGALIYINNGNMIAPTYSNSVYGIDKSIHVKETFQRYDQITMPVYGLKEGGKAFLAIIEKGAALAKINAEVSGSRYSYNSVYPQFYVLQYNSLNMSSLDGKNSRNVYQENIAQSDLKIRFQFLAGDKADYSGMALAYREYLLKNNLLNQTDYAPNTRLYVTYVGAIDRVKTVFGLPVTVREPLTTFDQAKTITEALRDAGVQDLDIRYIGWMNGGYNHSVTKRIKVENSLGGKGKLNDFAEYVKSIGSTLYLDASFEYAYKDGLFDGFTTFSDSIRFLDRTTKPAYDLDIATYQHDKLFKKYIIKPTSIAKYSDSYISILDSYGNIGGISARTMGKDVNSDFNIRDTYDRTMTVDIYKEQLAKLGENYKLMVVGGNDYSLAEADVVLNSSLTSNGFNSTDVSVPFYQMVVHGYIDYTGADVNLSTNYTRNLLKTLETGASLSTTLIYVENSIVSKTDFNFLYSVNYEGWVSKVAEEYKRVNDVLKDLQTVKIVKHEILDNNVFCTTYENGTKIIVNYNKDVYQYGTDTVGAQDFLVKK